MNPDNSFSNVLATPPVLSVSALNQAVARMLERSFPLLWVSGEISNFTRAASGHWYFTLKDDAAQVRAVMFRGRAQYADFSPRNGDRVEVRTLVTLYAVRGDYQLSVEAIRRAGVGNLFEAFVQLKNRLTAEGLFDQARKHALPNFPTIIGIVTSPQAAALRDVLTTLQRRAPHVRIIIYPTPVQGEGAAKKIAQAIVLASTRGECDVLLLCRGGGSIEDLWSFNDEAIARAIVACAMPVITGVGHETDFTIADFAADLRAPTPTAAAELAAIPRNEWLATVQTQALQLKHAMQRLLSSHAQTLDWHAHKLLSPASHIKHERLRLLGLQNRLTHARNIPLTQAHHALLQLRSRLSARVPHTAAHRLQLAVAMRRLAACASMQAAQRRQTLAALGAQLEMLNPQRTLARGYSILSDQHGEIVRDPAQIKAGEQLDVTMARGAATIGISNVQAKSSNS